MNIVFLGTAKFAVPALERLLASPHKVLSVITQPDRPKGRGQEVRPSPVKEVAAAKGVHIYQPEDVNEYEFMRELRALSPDVIVVVAYGQKLGKEILQLPRFYCLNIHPSLLPKYRGPAPVARAILNGDSYTGVCVLKVVEKMDAGPVLGVARAEIPFDATTPDMEAKLSEVGADLLLDVLKAVQDRRAIELPQDDREATYAKKFEKNDGKVDWRKPAAKIHNFIRALQPFPCAFGFLNRVRINLHKAKPQRLPQRPNQRPGTIGAIDKDGIHVICGDGEVLLLELQPESKRRMSAEEFANGYKPKVGDFFS
jgi:methionyl-tRNA formyltransferase